MYKVLTPPKGWHHPAPPEFISTFRLMHFWPSHMFGKLIVSIVQDWLAGFSPIERKIKNRDGKMYLDFLQNNPRTAITCP